MIYLTQLIYIKEGNEDMFQQFEAVAIPLIKKYNGQLLLRVRPGTNSFIEINMEPPYEIHIVSFETEQDFRMFTLDEERKQFLHLKEQSVQSVLLIKGERL